MRINKNQAIVSLNIVTITEIVRGGCSCMCLSPLYNAFKNMGLQHSGAVTYKDLVGVAPKASDFIFGAGQVKDKSECRHICEVAFGKYCSCK